MGHKSLLWASSRPEFKWPFRIVLWLREIEFGHYSSRKTKWSIHLSGYEVFSVIYRTHVNFVVNKQEGHWEHHAVTVIQIKLWSFSVGFLSELQSLDPFSIFKKLFLETRVYARNCLIHDLYNPLLEAKESHFSIQTTKTFDDLKYRRCLPLSNNVKNYHKKEK